MTMSATSPSGTISTLTKHLFQVGEALLDFNLKGFEFVEDLCGGLVFDFVVDDFFVAVDAEVVVVGGDVGFEDAE